MGRANRQRGKKELDILVLLCEGFINIWFHFFYCSYIYSGRIYNQRMLEQFNEYLQTFAIKKVALYGMGMGGKAFLKLVDKLKLELIYCIDQEKRETGGLDLYSPENDMPDVDAVIITLREHNHVVDEFLKTKFRKFFYWEDFVKGNDCSG